MAIKARTNELGTRRALGAAAGDIFLQIFLETLLLSVAGAAFALVVGYVITNVSERKADLPVGFDWIECAGLLAYSVLLNQVFGFIAARRAARIDPIAALKSE